MTKLTVSNERKKDNPEKEITFEFYAPSAKEVSLATSFNGWDASKNPLKKSSAGKWRLTLLLKPGRYEYRYLVDGNWENDQRPVACVPNAFGTWNCIVEVH